MLLLLLPLLLLLLLLVLDSSLKVACASTLAWQCKKCRSLLLLLLLLLLLQGLMTARYIPNNGSQFLITAGHGALYVLDALKETVKQVGDQGRTCT